MKKFEKEPGKIFVEFDETSKRQTNVSIVKPFIDGGLMRTAKIFCSPVELKMLMQIISQMMSDSDFRKAVQKMQNIQNQTQTKF